MRLKEKVIKQTSKVFCLHILKSPFIKLYFIDYKEHYKNEIYRILVLTLIEEIVLITYNLNKFKESNKNEK